ncbi:MAG: type 2 lanthipeptide synthetase LanM family protein, partial [Acidobacteriota bacterium]
RLLGADPPEPDGYFAWLAWIERAFSAADGREPMPVAPPEATPGRHADGGDRLFLEVIRPFLDAAWNRLLEALDTPSPRSGGDRHKNGIGHALGTAADRGHFAAEWARHLPDQLLQMGIRTWILELYIRRLEGTLRGETPESRFQAFVNELRSAEGAREFWGHYPVLARSIAVRIDQWVKVGAELAEHLRADSPALEARFGASGRVESLKASQGDRHDGGRTVVIFTFSNGVRVVYKPRSLALDVVFQDLLGWLGERGVEPRLRTLTVLDAGDRGWVEFVSPSDCATEGEVERFYRRQGIYLALLFVLEATDFHHENLIADGEHPVLIDLESLFQPALLDSDEAPEDVNPVATTVLRSGLLPRFSWGDQGTEGVDMSGLGGEPELTVPVRELSGVGTDEMVYADGVATMKRGDHRPRLRGEVPPLWRYSSTILESFAATYRRLLELRPEFLGPGGWLDRFAGLETRVIPRATGLYVRLLYVGYHPDHLRDALGRDQLFDKLWFDAARFPFIPSLIPHERHDLWLGDVPRFGSHTDSRDLVSSTGARISHVLFGSGLELARLRFERLSERDLSRQLSLATTALAAVRPPAPPDPHLTTAAAVPPDTPPDALPAAGVDRAIRAALRVGDRLELLAFRSPGWASWFHLRPVGAGPQRLEPVDASLYSGLAGIAVFLAQLGAVSGEGRYTELAREAFAVGRERFVNRPEVRQSVGGYSGLGGWVYGLCHLGALWRDPALLDEAESVAELIGPLLPSDQGLDVIAGAAGALVALLELHRHRPSAATLALAVACGESLLAKAETQAHGAAWTIPSVAPLPLTGFAHGAAGLAWALARLGAVTDDPRFHAGANGGLAYERSLFSTRQQNWPDLRHDRRQDGEWSYFHAWCHGAPGIGLSRLDLLRRWHGDRLHRAGREAEIRAAARSTIDAGFGDNSCLCHGDLGNVELVDRAAATLGDPDLEQASAELQRRILKSLEAGPIHCGINSRAELPGLMTGVAGVGYGLLRLASPSTVPSVLLLETPASS